MAHTPRFAAACLIAWSSFALGMQALPIIWQGLLTALLLPLALCCARQRSLAMLRRALWLMLTLAVLFLFATPGLYLDGWAGEAGITKEGLALSVEHLLRLVLFLLSLSLLHQFLGNTGLLVGLYYLCGLLPEQWRERLVVRLALVLDYVEHRSAQAGNWRNWINAADDGEPQTLTLPLGEAVSSLKKN